jgi:RimJ/RimL family protein N-acetyltransferase
MLKKDVVIRTAKTDDASRILDIQKEVILEGAFLITVSEEFNKTVEQQREWIEGILANDKETVLVAETTSGVVGWVVCLSPNRIRLRHTSSLGMMIEKESRNSGIGRLLIEGVVEWATLNPTLEKLTLGVFSTNERAIALYKKMGFLEEGRKIREFKISDTEYIDDVLMYKLV